MKSGVSAPHKSGAAEYLPSRITLPQLREAIPHCRGCELYRHALQAVPGEGPRSSRIAFIGEQPGNEEDKSGHPFVGPAGRLFDHALEDAEIDRAQVFVANAVKHFKFAERGKRRLHKKPSVGETMACRPWLEAELSVVRPALSFDKRTRKVCGARLGSACYFYHASFGDIACV